MHTTDMNPPSPAANGTESIRAKTAPGLWWRWRGWRDIGTIKLRVVLVAVVSALLSGAASTFFMAQKTESVARDSFNHQQQDAVELVAEMLDSKLGRVQANLRLLAQGLTPAMLRQPALLQRQLQGHALALELFESLQVLGLDGAVQASAWRGDALRAQADFGDPAYFRKTVASGAAAVAVPLPKDGAQKPEPVVLVSAPIHGADGQVLAVLQGALSLRSPDLLPPTMSTLGQYSAALIVYDQDGVILAHPDAQRRLHSVLDEPGLGPVFARQAGLPKPRPQAAMGGVATPEERFLVATAGVPSAGWTVARVTASAFALEPLRQVYSDSWGVVLAIMGMCAAMAGSMIAAMTQPISQLRDRAEQLLDPGQDLAVDWPRASGEIGQLVRVFRHVTQERARAQAAQRQMVGQLKAILQNASVGIAITRERRFELVGSHVNRLFGYAEGELLGCSAEIFYSTPQAYAAAGELFSRSLNTQGYFDGDVMTRRKDGSPVLVHLRGRNVVDGDPCSGVIWTLADVTAARAMQDQLSWSASHDSLTQLVNRRDFEARLNAAIMQTTDPAGSAEFCAMFIDLDRFKPINDTAGHAAGDEVLRQIARLLETCVRQSDTVARLGGDEFAILLPGCSLQRALRIAEQVRLGVASWRMPWHHHIFDISASIGVVTLSPALPDVAAVLEAADKACYAAKRTGRNQVVTYSPALQTTRVEGADDEGIC